MAKPVAPLLAFDARGTIAKTQVYSSWRGRAYVRRWTVPANPRTSAQTETRTVFSWLQAIWKVAPTLFQAPWTLYAKGQPLTDRNAFSMFNIPTLRPATDLSVFNFSPGAKGGLPVTSYTVTAGSGTLALVPTVPSAPPGWSITNVVAACIEDQDPHSGILYTVTAAANAVSPYHITLSGLAHTVLYQIGMWIEWTKPDGTFAYGPAVQSSGTPT